MNVGDKVRVKPSEAHYHSNRFGTVTEIREGYVYAGVYDGLFVELVSPTRRPSLVSYTAYRRAVWLAPFYFDELEVVA